MPEDIEKRYTLLERVILSDDPNFDRTNYKLIHIYNKDGFLFFSFAHKNGKDHVFEIYKDKDIKLEKPEFINNIKKLKESYNRKKELGNEKPYLSFEWLKVFPNERPDTTFEEQRRMKWYKRATLKAFYEALKFMGYEHEWDEISKMLPSVYQVPKEKMERYCGDNTTLMAYWTIFGELWSDKPYPNLSLVGAEMAHIREEYKNQGRIGKLNSLQKEHLEWKEMLTRLHLDKLMKLDFKEKRNNQMVLRFFSEDPHAAYYEATRKLVEKIENSLPSERRKLLSYEGYKKWLIENTKAPLDKILLWIHMFNVIARTPMKNLGEQKRNVKFMIDLLRPKNTDFYLFNTEIFK